MSTIANPIPGYYGAPSQPYHSSNPGKYNRTILASATFIATGSNAGMRCILSIWLSSCNSYFT